MRASKFANMMLFNFILRKEEDLVAAAVTPANVTGRKTLRYYVFGWKVGQKFDNLIFWGDLNLTRRRVQMEKREETRNSLVR